VTTPTVSIILPTFNRLPYLRTAVDSVFSQSFEDWELIIADDGSGSETQSYLQTIAGRPRVKWLSLAHSGNPPAVRNIALRAATAQYVAFLDSDDIWLPGKLAAQVASLQSRPTRKWGYTRCRVVDASGHPLAGKPTLEQRAADGPILESLLRGKATVVQSSVIVSRELVMAVGGYPEDLPICGDYELYVKLALQSEIDLVDEPLVLVRRHGEHYYDDVTALLELRRFLDRVRRSGVATPLDSILRERCALLSAGLAKGYAAAGSRLRAVRTLIASASSSWRYPGWWHGAMAATGRAFGPAWLRTAVRRYRTGRPEQAPERL
jgi:glycosyltransferase involved in cell wall biosynthesis